MRILLGILLLSLPVGLLTAAANTKKKEAHATPTVKHDQEIQTRDYMIEVSRQLGVTCNYCHDVKNFRSSEMKAWKKSKEHMRIVELLNHKGFTNGPKADCYLCHRGKAVPDFKEVATKPDPAPSAH